MTLKMSAHTSSNYRTRPTNTYFLCLFICLLFLAYLHSNPAHISSWLFRFLLQRFNTVLTVHLRIILVGDQLEAQFLLQYVFLNPLHVSSNYVLILRRTIVLIQLLV